MQASETSMGPMSMAANGRVIRQVSKLRRHRHGLDVQLSSNHRQT